MCGQHHAPAAFTPGKDPVHIVQEAGWATEPVWIPVENLAPLGFDHQTFQPIESRYTDYAILAPYNIHLPHRCHALNTPNLKIGLSRDDSTTVAFLPFIENTFNQISRVQSTHDFKLEGLPM